MKNLLLVFSLFTFLGLNKTQAQIQEGTKIFNTNLNANFSQSRTEIYSSFSQTKFRNSHFGLGGSASVNFANISTIYNYFAAQIGANGIYVFNPSQKFKFYTALGFSGGIGTIASTSATPLRVWSSSENLSLGGLKFINENIALNPNIGVFFSQLKGGNVSTQSNGFAVGLTLTPFFQNGVFSEIAEDENLIAKNRITSKGNIQYSTNKSKGAQDWSDYWVININAGYFIGKGLELGAELNNDYINSYLTYYLQMKKPFCFLGELKYNKAFDTPIDRSFFVPAIGGAYFLNKNIAVIGKLSYYRATLSAFNATEISVNMKYFLR